MRREDGAGRIGGKGEGVAARAAPGGDHQGAQHAVGHGVVRALLGFFFWLVRRFGWISERVVERGMAPSGAAIGLSRPRTRILWAGDELAFAHKTHTDALCIHQLLEYVHVDGYHNIMQLQLRMLL